MEIEKRDQNQTLKATPGFLHLGCKLFKTSKMNRRFSTYFIKYIIKIITEHCWDLLVGDYTTDTI